MGGNKGLAVAVLIVIILGAVVFIMRGQRRAGDAPDWVMDQEVQLITAEQPFETETYRLREIHGVPVDSDTGYRRIGGQLWATPMVCATSDLRGDPHRIPAPPRPHQDPQDYEELGPDDVIEDPEDEPYECPICGEEANPMLLEMRRFR